LGTADFSIDDCRLRLRSGNLDLTIVDLALNQQSPISIVNPQSENRQSPIRNPQSITCRL
jgi:hypothetical protein